MRFGYDGAGFYGWAHQPGRRTVEGELLAALREHRLFRDEAPSVLPVASRTDRGVSARGNALLLASRVPATTLLRALNGLSPDIFFTHAREVGPAFLPRRAAGRVYRYLEPAHGHSITRWRSLARGFVGTLDARSFGRGLPADRPTLRTLTHVEVRREGEWLVVELEGLSFVWGMVRKIIAALREAESGDVSERQLDEARRGVERISLPLAEPEGLILWEVLYPTPWTFAAGPPPVSQRRYWDRCARDSRLRLEVLSRVRPDVSRASQGTD